MDESSSIISSKSSDAKRNTDHQASTTKTKNAFRYNARRWKNNIYGTYVETWCGRCCLMLPTITLALLIIRTMFDWHSLISLRNTPESRRDDGQSWNNETIYGVVPHTSLSSEAVLFNQGNCSCQRSVTTMAMNHDGTVFATGAIMGKYMTTTIFVRQATQVDRVKLILPNVGLRNLHLGKCVGLNDDGSVLVVAGNYEAETKQERGVVTILRRTMIGDLWLVEKIDIEPENNSEETRFGRNVAVSADGTIVVISGYEENGFRPTIWVYLLDTGQMSWFLSQKLTAGRAIQASLRFVDFAVALSADGNRILLLSRTEINDIRGTFWIFSKDAQSVWHLDATLHLKTKTANEANHFIQLRCIATDWYGKVAIVADPELNGARIVKRDMNTGIWMEDDQVLAVPRVSSEYNHLGNQGLVLRADGMQAILSGFTFRRGENPFKPFPAFWIFNYNSSESKWSLFGPTAGRRFLSPEVLKKDFVNTVLMDKFGIMLVMAGQYTSIPLGSGVLVNLDNLA